MDFLINNKENMRLCQYMQKKGCMRNVIFVEIQAMNNEVFKSTLTFLVARFGTFENCLGLQNLSSAWRKVCL